MVYQNSLKGYLFVIISAVIFGCNPLMVRSIYDGGINSLSLVLLRNLLSLPVLGILAFRKEKTLRIPAKALPSVFSIGLMGCCITPILLFSSYRYIASGTATVFHFVYPAAVVLGEVLVFRKKLPAGNLISVFVCAAGISLFYSPGESLDPAGSALALLSGVTYAIYILLLSNFRFPHVTGFLLSFHVSVISSIVMFAVCAASGQMTLPATAEIWIDCFLFSLVVNVGAVVLFQQGTFLIGGEKSSILSTLEPITSVIIGMAVFQETVGIRTLLGSVLVIAASVLITLTDRKQPEI